MRTIETMFDHKFVRIKAVTDPEHHVKQYVFAERLGVDSIAFICEDASTGDFLLNHEYTPPTNEFLDRAFGGSLDKKDKDLVEIVKDEVYEEAGFTVDKKDIKSMGKIFVSTQMNQYCHLFMVMVKKSQQHERHPENEVEAMSHPIWLTMDEILSGNDWKSIAIIAKFMAPHMVE